MSHRGHVLIPLYTYIEMNQRFAEEHIHGALHVLSTADPLNSDPVDINLTTGRAKIMIVVNAGSDFDGEITVTGTTVDRNTGAQTPADTDTITVDALTTDGSDVDAEGNVRHSFTGAYITSKWFTGSVVLSTVDLTLTDVDTYQVAFEQMDDNPGIHLDAFDFTALPTNANAWVYAYLYSVEVTGDKVNITRESSLELPVADVSADEWYRLRESGIDKQLDGRTDGFFVDLIFGPTSQTYWTSVNLKVWVAIHFP